MTRFTALMEEVDRSLPRARRDEHGAEKLQAELDKITAQILEDETAMASIVREYHDDPRVTVPEAIERYAQAILRQRLREQRLSAAGLGAVRF